MDDKQQDQKRRVFEIEQTTRDLLNNVDSELYADLMTSGTTPFYTEEDLNQTTDRLARLLRVIFIELGITKEYFEHRQRLYAQNVLGFKDDKKKIGSHKSNLIKAMKKDTMTWRTFMEIVFNVLGCILCNIRLEFIDPKGCHRVLSDTDTPTIYRDRS